MFMQSKPEETILLEQETQRRKRFIHFQTSYALEKLIAACRPIDPDLKLTAEMNPTHGQWLIKYNKKWVTGYLLGFLCILLSAFESIQTTRGLRYVLKWRRP